MPVHSAKQCIIVEYYEKQCEAKKQKKFNYVLSDNHSCALTTIRNEHCPPIRTKAIDYSYSLKEKELAIGEHGCPSAQIAGGDGAAWTNWPGRSPFRYVHERSEEVSDNE